MTPLMLLLVASFLVYILLGVWQRRRRARLGLAEGAILAADDSAVGSKTLRSARLGLVGQPDHLLRSGGCVIPVEHKPRAKRAHLSHVMQVAAECLLVQEVYGIRPPYGVLVLAGGVQKRVEFTLDLEQRLSQTMQQMRKAMTDGSEPGPRWVAPKCHACGFFEICWE